MSESDPLDVLLADGIIDEVLGRLKSGKEANISLVRRGQAVVAAKVYKDRATRSFKNNSGYKEGRKVRNSRTQRAMDSGGSFGRDAAEQAWKSAEADALYKLAGTGVRTPEVILFYEGVLLMDLVVDADGRPAPRLIDVALDRDAALGLYADLCAQIIAMLCCDLIHGDLSPYNILAGVEGPTIIDFPQVISAVHNTRAEYYFLRDFDNVVGFIAGFDPALKAHTADGRAIWRAYVSRELTPQYVPPPPPPPRATRGPDRRGPPPQQRPWQQRQPQPQPQRQSQPQPQRQPQLEPMVQPQPTLLQRVVHQQPKRPWQPRPQPQPKQPVPEIVAAEVDDPSRPRWQQPGYVAQPLHPPRRPPAPQPARPQQQGRQPQPPRPSPQQQRQPQPRSWSNGPQRDRSGPPPQQAPRDRTSMPPPFPPRERVEFQRRDRPGAPPPPPPPPGPPPHQARDRQPEWRPPAPTQRQSGAGPATGTSTEPRTGEGAGRRRRRRRS